MTSLDFDIIIAGAGPAGSTLTLALAPAGLRIGVFDRVSFPRETICGDALGGQVLRVMHRMPDGLFEAFLSLEPKLSSFGLRFISPAGHVLELPYPPDEERFPGAPGYLCPRYVFDSFLSGRLSRYPNISFFQGIQVERVSRMTDHLLIGTPSGTFRAAVVAGADGIRSVVRRDLGAPFPEKRAGYVAIRAYYKDVSSFPDPKQQHLLSLYFIKEVLPGYLWVFPDAGRGYNVGLGMFSGDLPGRKESMKGLLERILREHPLLAPRFSQAKKISPVQARGLAISSTLDNLSGERFVLLGDAARLVDPFTGEGIGEAMASAESAAQVIAACFRSGDFSALAFSEYDRRIHRRMGTEHHTSLKLQRFARYPWLIDFIVRKASRNHAFRDLLAKGYSQEQIRRRLVNPLFYLRLAGIG